MPAMLQDFGIDEEYDFFRDVGDVVARAFQLAEYTDQVQAGQRTFRMLPYIVSQDIGGFHVYFVQQVVFGKDLCGL